MGSRVKIRGGDVSQHPSSRKVNWKGQGAVLSGGAWRSPADLSQWPQYQSVGRFLRPLIFPRESGEGPFSFRVHSSWFIYCICFHQGLEVRTQFALELALFGGSTGNSSQPRTAGGKGRGSVLGWGAKCWSSPCSYSAIPAWPANVPVRTGLEVSRITWEFDLL